jgi:FkbM family methyltransferase
MKTFIEIGSNNYDTLVDLAKNNSCKGVIVEPIFEVFSSIERHPNCLYENSVISEEDGVKDFFYFNQITGWGSLEKKHVEKLGINPLLLKTVKVNSLTFDSLCIKYKINNIDLLKIDAESYDGKIIRSIDFAKYNIKQIDFEYEHLTENDLYLTQSYLIKNNYKNTKRTSNNLYYSKI